MILLGGLQSLHNLDECKLKAVTGAATKQNSMASVGHQVGCPSQEVESWEGWYRALRRGSVECQGCGLESPRRKLV